MSALDKSLLQLNRTSRQISDESSVNNDFGKKSVLKYNPYQTIPTEQFPNTYWECLSVLNTFTPLSCEGKKSYERSVILDLDLTDGASRALRVRYPRCIIYCSSLKTLTPESNADTGVTISGKRIPRTICEELLMYNTGGADFAFCVHDYFDIDRLVKYSIGALKPESTLAIRVKDYTSSTSSKAIEQMLESFSEVWVYKCATMSCITNECYLVGVNKARFGNAAGTLIGADTVRKFISQSKESIIEGIDNTSLVRIESVKNNYIGI